MNNPFAIVHAFLEQFDSDVEGRACHRPPEEIAKKIKALADGSLPVRQRRSVVLMLKKNPQWVEELAREAKRLRTESEVDPESSRF